MIVLGGKLKKRRIPFQNREFGDAETTPQKIKGALFSIIGEDLRNRSFLDLYACSGQIGIEAISREAEFVVMNETDKRRFGFIKSLIRTWGLEENTLILNLHAFKCLRYLSSRGFLFDYIYIDPPYVKTDNEVRQYTEILNELRKHPLLKEDGLIIIQHFSKNRIKEIDGIFHCTDRKKYGNNSLSFFRYPELSLQL